MLKQLDKFVFMVSTFLRVLSLQLLKSVSEPEQVSVGQFIRILRNVRGLNTTNGFHALLHPFVEAPPVDAKPQRPPGEPREK